MCTYESRNPLLGVTTPIHMTMGKISFRKILQQSENDPRETIMLLLTQVYK